MADKYVSSVLRFEGKIKLYLNSKIVICAKDYVNRLANIKSHCTYQYIICICVALIILSSYLYKSHENHIRKTVGERKWVLSEKCRDRQTINSKFPHIMHRIFGFWDNNIPEPWIDSLNSCKENGFQLMLWNKSMVVDLITEHYSWFLPQFLSYPHEVQRADVARYFILYHFGGIYLDMDVKCERSNTLTHFFKDISRNTTMKDTVLLSTEPFGVTNLYMLSKQCTGFMRHTLAMLETANHWYVVPYATVMFSTGPAFLSKSVTEFKQDLQFQSGIALLNSEDFWTKYFIDSGNHGTWHAWDADIILYLYNVLYVKNYGLIFVIFIVICIGVALAVCSKLPCLLMNLKRENMYFWLTRPYNSMLCSTTNSNQISN